MYDIFENEIVKIVRPEQIKKNEPLAAHTTFRIGGPADFLIIPDKIEQISLLLSLCARENIPYYILGNGSNILVSDEGYRGVVLCIGSEMAQYKFVEEDSDTVRVTAGAGIMLSKLANEVAKQGLTGFEFAAGIPGTLGGAITMNAGAYGGEIKDTICQVKVITSLGELLTLSKEELEMGYRTSIIQKEDYIVVEADFVFQKGNVTEIKEKISELNRQRREKQPLEYPSAGSTFKRPEGYFAGKLIMDAGLRGYRVGDVMVSEKHCGFVINVGNGTANDVRILMEDVTRIVYQKYKVKLEPEVRMLGF